MVRSVEAVREGGNLNGTTFGAGRLKVQFGILQHRHAGLICF